MRKTEKGSDPVRKLTVLALATALVSITASPAAQQAPRATFRSDVELVVVDVVVRDRSGNAVRGLTAADFEVREDNRPQEIVSFDIEEVTTERAPDSPGPPVLTVGTKDVTTERPPAPEPEPVKREDLAGRRLIVLLFDLSSMQPEELTRAGKAAVEYLDTQMAEADLVAVATVDIALNVVSDFTGDREQVKTAMARFSAVDGVAFETPAAETAATDEAGAETAATSAEYDLFNNDARLRAIRTLVEMLGTIEQKKSVLYFSGGMSRSGGDNQVELRAATSAAVRANVSLYPVDTRGLQATVPGGDASRPSARGVGAFSGRGVQQQFNNLFASQETLQTLAADTGGRAFTDTNNFGDAFTQVQRDTSIYYLLGYNSTATAKDGRFRRISVRLKRSDLRVEHRAGYYAERDFTHTGRQDRERQLQEQLTSPISATDLPVVVSAGWFRMAPDRYYIPLSVAVPGSALREGRDRNTLDVMGLIRDEQGRSVGKMRETITLASSASAGLATQQVLYQSGLTLPPGRFAVKVVVRENVDGRMGSFETGVFVPDLRQAAVKVSSVTLSTQVRPVTGQRSESPLVRQGLELLPSLTHVVDRTQKMYFYYEVYDPQIPDGGSALLKTSLAFYRGAVKVFETPLVERSDLDAADRRAAIFQFEVPAEAFKPGLYTCQVNIIDDVAGRFAFPRLALYVR